MCPAISIEANMSYDDCCVIVTAGPAESPTSKLVATICSCSRTLHQFVSRTSRYTTPDQQD